MVNGELVWGHRAAGPPDVVEHAFQLITAGHVVPGVLWTPVRHCSTPRPAVLLGHGGSGHKCGDPIRRRARSLARQADVAVVAIDGPYHGDRVDAALPADVYQRRNVDDGVRVVSEQMVADWLATVDALADGSFIATEPVAYLGLSMGARFGVPLAAALGPRLSALVIGKFGLTAAGGYDGGLIERPEFEKALRAISAPTLVHVQWDDELFPRDGQLAMFDLLAGRDKQLVAHPGGHSATPDGAEEGWLDFVIRHLPRR